MTQPTMDFETWLVAEGQRRAAQGLSPLAPMGGAETPASDQGPDFADVSTRADALEAAGVVSYAVAGLDGGYDGAVALLADTVRVARSYVERAALAHQEAANDAQAKRTADLARARWQAARDQADRLGTNGHGLGAKPAEAPKPKRTPEQILQALHGLHGEASALLDEADAQGQAAAVQAAALSARPLFVAHAVEACEAATAAVDPHASPDAQMAQCAAWQAAQGELQRISGEPHRGDDVALLDAFPWLLTVAASPAIAWYASLHALAVTREASRTQEAQEAHNDALATAYWDGQVIHHHVTQVRRLAETQRDGTVRWYWAGTRDYERLRRGTLAAVHWGQFAEERAALLATYTQHLTQGMWIPDETGNGHPCGCVALWREREKSLQ